MKKIEIQSVKSFDDLKRLFADNKELLKTAALPLVIGVAVLFFWFYGAEEDIVVSEGDDVSSEIVSEDTRGQTVTSTEMYVDISGAVVNPGVYEVSSSTRLFQVIEMAGGLADNADVDSLNRAEIVYDGQKIIVGTASNSEIRTEASSEGSQSGITNGKVNLNLADSATLQTIPGIGPSKAERIIDYRTTQGRFKKAEDIMNITGIGEKTFESIRDYITV